MPEIRIPVIVSGAEALREMDSIARGTTNSLRGMESASKALQTSSIATSADIKAMTVAIQANTAALSNMGSGFDRAAGGATRLASGTRVITTELKMMEGAMPIRAAASFLSHLEGINKLMTVAFPVFGAVALVGVLEQIPDAIEKGTNKLRGWGDAARKEYTDVIQLASQLADIQRRGQLEMMDIPTENLTGSGLVDAHIASGNRKLDTVRQQREQASRELQQLKDRSKQLEKPGWLDYVNPSPVAGARIGTLALGKEREQVAAALAVKQQDLDNLLKQEANLKVDVAKENLRRPGAVQKEQDEADKKAQEKAQAAANKAANELKAAQQEVASYIEKSLSPLERTTAEYQKQLQILKQFPGAGSRAAVDNAYHDNWLNAANAELSRQHAEQARFDADMSKGVQSANKQGEEEWKSYLDPADRALKTFGAQQVEKARAARRIQLAQVDSGSFRREAGFNARMVEIGARPGGEAAAVQLSGDIRTAAVDRQLKSEIDAINAQNSALATAEQKNAQIAEAKKAAAIEVRDIEISTAERLAELQKKRLDDYRKTSGEIFDALNDKRGAGRGLSDFFHSQVTGIERTLFTNAAGIVQDRFKGQFHSGNLIPGQTDGNGNPTLIGRLLQGTPFAKDSNSDIKVANEYLNRNNILTQTNNEQLAKLNGNLNPQATSTSGGSGAIGGFSSALSTFAALARIGGSSTTSAVASGLSTMKYSAADIARAGYPDASSYDRALQVAEYKARAGMGQGDAYILAAAKGGLPTNPATGAPWAKDPRMNDTARLAIATGFSPITDYNRIPDPAVPSVPTTWFRRDLLRANDWMTHHSSDIAAAGTAAGMGFGAYEGFKQGTTRGDLAGSAAIVGGVTSLLGNPSIQKMIGTVASSVPIVGSVVSVGLGLVSSLIGNSAQQRRDQMENEVKGSYDRLAPALNKQFDISGYSSDITGAGSARSITINNTTHIDAIDQKSIVDHWPAISEAVRMGVNQNHPVVDSLRQTL